MTTYNVDIYSLNPNNIASYGYNVVNDGGLSGADASATGYNQA